jgi:hypothetical protein
MKWAKSLIVDACLFGRYIPIDDIEYLDTRFDVLGERQINEELKIKNEECITGSQEASREKGDNDRSRAHSSSVTD